MTGPSEPSPLEAVRDRRERMLWGISGALVGLAVAGIGTIGPLVLPLGAVATLLSLRISRRPHLASLGIGAVLSAAVVVISMLVS